MTANIANPNKRRYCHDWRSTGKPADRDHVAPMMVAGWSPEQARRIRGILLTLLMSYPQDADLLATPEIGVVAMIDRRQ